MYGVGALASEFLRHDSAVCNMTHHATKTSQVGNEFLFRCSIVEPEYLFICVSEQVKWFDANVCALQSTLEQAPEILQSVCVNLSVNVAFRMVDYLVREI